MANPAQVFLGLDGAYLKNDGVGGNDGQGTATDDAIASAARPTWMQYGDI